MSSYKIKVKSENVTYSEDYITSKYKYQTTRVTKEGEDFIVEPREINYTFRTGVKVPKLGVMIVGWGGSNGSALTAGVVANREGITWNTKNGVKSPNYFGSLFQSSTIRLGIDEKGKDVYIPFKDVLPSVNPNDITIGGWDISSANIYESVVRAKVLDYNLMVQLKPYLEGMNPLPSIYVPDFIAANQEDRANNVIKGKSVAQMIEHVQKDMKDFKEANKLDKVVILWSANTERFSEIIPGVNDTWENLEKAIANNHTEISPSTMFAIAALKEGNFYINGSPQNTFVPGVIELAYKVDGFIAGDDFKTGQTKFKSVMTAFLVSAGIKPVSIVSYNHLGNNDGKNLSSQKQFRSKEISKSNVVDDMVDSNRILYKEGEHPDHVVVIKYVPYVGDSKRALDEYTSEIFLNGLNTIVVHNTCEDTLLAVPIMLDLVIVAELSSRIDWKTDDMENFEKFDTTMSILSYLLKAPQVPRGTPIVNALSRQRATIENIFKACIGIAPENNMLLEQKTKLL